MAGRHADYDYYWQVKHLTEPPANQARTHESSNRREQGAGGPRPVFVYHNRYVRVNRGIGVSVCKSLSHGFISSALLLVLGVLHGRLTAVLHVRRGKFWRYPPQRPG